MHRRLEAASFPLQGYNILHSRDVDEVREKVSRAYCSHSLFLRSPHQNLHARHHRVSFGDVSFNYLQYGADVTVVPGMFQRFFMIEIPLSGTAHIRYGMDSVASAKRTGSVVSPTQPVYSEWSADAKRLMVQIDRRIMERFATNVLGHALNKPLEFKLSLDLSTGIGAGLGSYVKYIVNQLTSNNYFDKYLLVRKEVERTIMTMLLNGQSSNYSEEIRAVEVPGAPKYIERAYEYLMANYTEDVSIDTLVKVSGVSIRALFAGFKKYKGVSPMVALKTRRLHAVHDDLAEPGPNDTVTKIALKWGFTHLGNFAHDYYKMFGEKPSETIYKAR